MVQVFRLDWNSATSFQGRWEQESRVSGSNKEVDRMDAMTRTPVVSANQVIPDPYTCIWCSCFRGRWYLFADSEGKSVSAE